MRGCRHVLPPSDRQNNSPKVCFHQTCRSRLPARWPAPKQPPAATSLAAEPRAFLLPKEGAPVCCYISCGRAASGVWNTRVHFDRLQRSSRRNKYQKSVHCRPAATQFRGRAKGDLGVVYPGAHRVEGAGLAGLLQLLQHVGDMCDGAVSEFPSVRPQLLLPASDDDWLAVQASVVVCRKQRERETMSVSPKTKLWAFGISPQVVGRLDARQAHDVGSLKAITKTQRDRKGQRHITVAGGVALEPHRR